MGVSYAKEAVKAYNIPWRLRRSHYRYWKAKVVAREIGFPILIRPCWRRWKRNACSREWRGVWTQMKRAISEAINALVMVLFYWEIRSHHAISKFKLWLTVMEYLIYSKENAAYNVAIKSHRRSSFLCFNTRITKKWVRPVLVAKSCDYLGAGTVEFLLDENNFFSSKWITLTGGTSCDGMDYWTGFSRITNQGS
jgi:propionyl-CoA carboxylase alpha chain